MYVAYFKIHESPRSPRLQAISFSRLRDGKASSVHAFALPIDDICLLTTDRTIAPLVIAEEFGLNANIISDGHARCLAI
jgi:hypothetical protein